MNITNASSIETNESLSFVTAVSVPSPVIIKPFKSKKWYTNSLGQCSCVEYVKARLGIVGTLGNAWNIKPETQIPEVGAIILFKAHVGYVTDYDGQWVTYDDYNWISCKERRSVKVYVGDKSIRGYVISE